MWKSTPACGWSPGPSAACLRVLVMRIAPFSREFVNVQFTVWPPESPMDETALPSLQVDESRFHPAGTVSAASYVPGLRFENVLESLPACPGPVVVSVNAAGESVFDVKLNAPLPSLVT